MQVALSRSPNQVVAMRLLMRKLGTSNSPTVMRSIIRVQETGGKPEAERRDGPEKDGDGIENSRMHMVDKPATGDLERRVGPAERGKHQPELDRVVYCCAPTTNSPAQ